jgi:hypothetical protein
MSWSIVIRCDKTVAFHEGRPIGTCPTSLSLTGANGERARLRAAEAGWLLVGGQDLCPTHNPLRFHPLARPASQPAPIRPPVPPEGGRITPLRPRTPSTTV